MPASKSEITLTLLHPTSGASIQCWTFSGGNVLKIGRAQDNDVVLRSEVVSRYHAELRHDGDGWVLFGLGSNGTFVNHDRITQHRLADGEVFVLAPTGPIIGFRYGESAANMLTQTMHAGFAPLFALAVDEDKKTTQVAQIAESDYFQRLQSKVATMRAPRSNPDE